MAAGARRGFSLIELVVVLGGIGIMVGVGVLSATRSRDRIELDRSASSLRAEIERVRSLSRVAGPRLGTTRLVLEPGCIDAGGGLLWVQIDPGARSVVRPTSVRHDPLSDTLRATCEPWDFGGTRGAGADALFAAPATTLVFGFAANGRVVFPAGTFAPPALPPDVFVQLRHAGGGPPSPGFRVLPSGVTCVSSVPGPGGPLCDEVR